MITKKEQEEFRQNNVKLILQELRDNDLPVPDHLLGSLKRLIGSPNHRKKGAKHGIDFINSKPAGRKLGTRKGVDFEMKPYKPYKPRVSSWLQRNERLLYFRYSLKFTVRDQMESRLGRTYQNIYNSLSIFEDYLASVESA